jgi:acetyl esterase/lipase
MSLGDISHAGKREGGRPASAEMLRLRGEMDARGSLVSAGVTLVSEPACPGKSEWVIPEGAGASRAAILFLHGSGYSKGSPASHRPLVARIVAEAGIPALSLDYRLAPEHRFPAPVEDALAAYRLLLDQCAPEQLALIGDSAGGGLALSLLLAAKEEGLPLPACAVTLSAWTDLAVTGDPRPDVDDPIVTQDMLRAAAALYLDGADTRHPLASPLYGDLSGLPPLLMQVGGREIMQEDTRRLAEKACASGVPVTMRVYPGMPHVFPLRLPEEAQSREAIGEIAAFVADHLAPHP